MKIGFVSLGCPKNLVDSEVMLGMAEQAGHEITTDADGADVVIVNTCAFIDRAKQESIDTILEMAGRKKATGGRLVVTGCLAERYRDSLQNEIPEIDAVLGTGDVPNILEAIQPGSSLSRAAGAAPLTFYKRDALPPSRGGGSRTAGPGFARQHRGGDERSGGPGRWPRSSAWTCPRISTTPPPPAVLPPRATTPT